MTKRRSSVLIVEKDLSMIIFTRSIESVFMRRHIHITADTRIARQSTMTQAIETAMRGKNMEQFLNKIYKHVIVIFIPNILAFQNQMMGIHYPYNHDLITI